MAALAKGGRTNFLGFLLRLAASLPFLFIAGRLYGPEALGRFALAIIAVEFAAQIATIGQKRGIAQQLAHPECDAPGVVADAMLLSVMGSTVLAAVLFELPELMFPHHDFDMIERLLPLTVLPLALADIALAALAFRYDIAATVRARSIVQPWTLSIAALVLWFVMPVDGLIVAYVLSMAGAMITALVPLLRSYGLPRNWSPHPITLGKLALRNLPLAGADAVEWGTRRLDIAILGQFAPPSAVGVYYVAQQVASLPQKLKTSFEPILGPVIARNLAENNHAAIARQVSQAGFWIVAAQVGIALALGIPGEGVMGLVGPHFVGGTGALALLLFAEVVAATAVVSEAALIYVARMRNLSISLATIGLQALLTVTLMVAVRSAPGWNLPGGWHFDASRVGLFQAAGAALALALALGFASLMKSNLLARVLCQSVNNWRWALIYAAAPAVLVGWLATRFLPEWAELAFGIPAILGVYGTVIWRWGFGPEDRVLFKRRPF
ncbi:MAG: oligosaccharide flippase family protein [Sphingomonadales bacterium]|nr:oligosaccharide flippase family protein [Sphingomonadales bacterium]MDE2569743.1 oligosaccharide flippase family protein [Sphingomonadales bacterium]